MDLRFHPLPKQTPELVPLASGGELRVVAFYCPSVGLTEWDRRTGGAPYANFWPLAPHTITISHNGVSGTFHNAEAAYQCMKWWQHEGTRQLFVGKCTAPDFSGGGQAYELKKEKEKDTALKDIKATDFDGLGKNGAMLKALREKWRLPEFAVFLRSSAGVFLVEHCEVSGRDLVWTDNFNGGGENRLGAALMAVRSELLAEIGADGDGWPEGIQRPEWLGGPVDSNWQQIVDEVAKHLAANTRETPLTAPSMKRKIDEV